MGTSAKKVSLEAQLEALAELGIVPAPRVRVSDLELFHSRAVLEAEPYKGLVTSLASESERPPHAPMCAQLWLCDFERIEDHGDYVSVLQRLEELTGDALGLVGLSDYVDLEEGTAWVEFSTGGAEVRWDFEVEDDWMDPEVLTQYQALLADADTDVRLFESTEDHGQSSLIAAFTPATKRSFEQLTGLRFREL